MPPLFGSGDVAGCQMLPEGRSHRPATAAVGCAYVRDDATAPTGDRSDRIQVRYGPMRTACSVDGAANPLPKNLIFDLSPFAPFDSSEGALGTFGGRVGDRSNCKRQTNTGLTAPPDFDGLDPGCPSAGREFSSSATPLIGKSAKSGSRAEVSRGAALGTGQIDPSARQSWGQLLFGRWCCKPFARARWGQVKL